MGVSCHEKIPIISVFICVYDEKSHQNGWFPAKETIKTRFYRATEKPDPAFGF
jgi:hypothetical protein